MDPVAFSFSLFGLYLEVRWYAIIITIGMILALLFLLFELKKTGQPSDLGLELFIWVVPFAVLFGRLFFSVPRIGQEFFLDSFAGFLELFAVWQGGITIIGGIFGGIIGAFFCCLVRKKSLPRILDLLVCPLLIGQIIGRWGNYINEEVYGIVVPNGFPKFPLSVFVNGQWHYATFFYESMLNLVALIFFVWLFLKYRDKLKAGTMVLGYLIWYNFLRAMIEFIKEGAHTIGGIKVIQLICFIVLGISIVLLILVQKNILKLETETMRQNHFSNIGYQKRNAKNKSAEGGLEPPVDARKNTEQEKDESAHGEDGDES